MNRNRGITLISLIITIIILLILAGVTINLTVGETGIFTKAKQAKEDYLVAVNTEQELLANAEKALEGTTTGGNTGDDTEQPEEPEGTPKLKIGDYVDYEPTKADANKTIDVNSSLLTYTSPKGGYNSVTKNMDHGNGYEERTYTALQNDNLYYTWRILNIMEDRIEIIPSLCTQNLTLSTHVGYLFAEEELHNISAIYGHGYGAITNLETTYTIGGPFDNITRTLKSGARSLTGEDINKIAGIDLNDICPSYGSTFDMKRNIYYPTLQYILTNYPGVSSNTKTEFIDTSYSYSKSLIENEILQEMLFVNSRNKWLATKMLYTDGLGGLMLTAGVASKAVVGPTNSFSYATSSQDAMTKVYTSSYSTNYVCPVVSIYSEKIDLENISDDIGTSTNPWKLK